MPNDVRLQEGHPVDENLRPIKVGGKSTALEVSERDVRVNNLYVNGTTTGVSASDSTKLPLAGGTMTGDITTDSDIVSTNLTINDSGDISLDADGGEIRFKDGDTEFARLSTALSKSVLILFESAGSSANDYFGVSVGASGSTIIATTDGGGTGGDLTVDIDGDIALDSHTGVFIAKKAGTEFSAANSSYAGMILGYTDIGLNESAATYNLTTGYVVPTDEFSVSFVAPPSGNVEIFIQIGLDLGSGNNGDLFAGLSTANATSGYNALQSYHEIELFDGMSRGALRTISHSWTATGLIAGNAYEWWVGFKSTSTTGTPHLQWGGNGSDQTPDFIMKATALPATITT